MNDEQVIDILRDCGVLNIGKTSKYISMSCPLAKHTHTKGTDGHPSCLLYKDGWTYHCFTCKANGPFWDLIDNIIFYEGRQDLQKYVDQLIAGQIVHLTNPETWYTEARREKITFPKQAIERLPSAIDCTPSRDYLISRGIDLNLAEFYMLKYDPELKRVVFPIFDLAGDLVGIQGRTVVDHPKRYYNYFNFNKSNCIGGLQAISALSKVVYVVEGFMGLLKLKSICPKDTILTTFGAGLSEAQATILLSLDKFLYSCYDRDEAGDNARNHFKRRLKNNIYPIKNILPQKDIDNIDINTFLHSIAI